MKELTKKVIVISVIIIPHISFCKIYKPIVI